MPQRRNSAPAPTVTTWTKALPVLAVCVIFDAIRFLFEQFWFFGPALIGAGAAAAASGYVGSTLGTALGGGVAVAAGILGGAALEAFGIIMAMAIGLLGWLTVGLVLMVSNPRIFKTNASHSLWFVLSLAISEVPILGTIPALTVVTWRMYHTQIKTEKAARAQFEKEQALAQTAERAQQMGELVQARAMQEQQEEEVVETESVEEEAREEEAAVLEKEEVGIEEKLRAYETGMTPDSSQTPYTPPEAANEPSYLPQKMDKAA